MTSLKKTKVLLLLFLIVETAKALGGVLYISPGIQIGKTSDGEFFYSLQMTIGSFIEIGVRSGCVGTECPGYDLPVIPGITIGVRKYKEYIIRFTDVQLAFPFGGIGIGYSWIRPSIKSNLNTNWVKGNRVKLWGGFLINATYDSFRLPDSEKIRNWGIIGVLPLPVLWWGNTGPLFPT